MRKISISNYIGKKIIGLYGLGMSYSDNQKYIDEIHDFEVSDGILSRIKAKYYLKLKNSLESVYSFIYLDAMHYKFRVEGQVKFKAIYSVLGVTMKDQKEVLGIYFANFESSSFWCKVLNDEQNRGLEDVFIASIDNLSGFGDAIEDYYPKNRGSPLLCISNEE